MVVAKITKFEDHDKITQLLIEELQREQPSGYSTLSVEQLQRADKEIWSLIGKETAKTGVQQDFEGRFPAGQAVQAVIDHPTVRMLLPPLPSPPSSSKPSTGNEVLKKTPQQIQGTPRQTRTRTRSTQPLTKGHCSQGNEGASFNTPDGSRIGFGYNNGNCQVKGAGCGRGKHVCTKCFGAHPSSQCQKSFQ